MNEYRERKLGSCHTRQAANRPCRRMGATGGTFGKLQVQPVLCSCIAKLQNECKSSWHKLKLHHSWNWCISPLGRVCLLNFDHVIVHVQNNQVNTNMPHCQGLNCCAWRVVFGVQCRMSLLKPAVLPAQQVHPFMKPANLVSSVHSMHTYAYLCIHSELTNFKLVHFGYELDHLSLRRS